ncbi:MAG TPA: sigma-54 dependent transcriptional regulator [Alphaproteobacteria bacterium]
MNDEILIVDDEKDIRLLVSGILEDENYQTRQAENTQKAWDEINRRSPSLIILDVWFENAQEDGLNFLKRLQRDYSHVPVIMISGHGNIETAVQAIHHGAYDFIEKPFKSDRLLLTVQRALSDSTLKRENAELKKRFGGATQLIGQSPLAQQLRENLEKVAATNSRVLFTGPAGAGKEIAARNMHAKSKRATQPFVILNCATLRAQDMEEELFGWEDRNTTGERKIGLLERAHGGTVLLDEIADMPAETQAKMVRVLQDQRFERLGSGKAVEVDIRFMAATNRNLQTLIETGQFRQDLYYRLNVMPLNVPSLKERIEDVPVLTSYFMEQIAGANGLKIKQIGHDALAVLQNYAWPGNIRQLRNLMEWLLIMRSESGETIRAEMLPPEFRNATLATTHLSKADEIMRLPLREAREIFEREYLLSQINRFGGNISRTAHFVGMERSALHRKLKLLEVERNDSEAA